MTALTQRVSQRVPARFLPVLATVVLFVLTFGAGSASYDGFASGQIIANLFIDNAFLIVLAFWISIHGLIALLGAEINATVRRRRHREVRAELELETESAHPAVDMTRRREPSRT